MALNKDYIPKTLLQEYYKKFWTEFNKWCAKDELFCKEFKNHPYASIRSYQDYCSLGEPYHIPVGINFKKHEIHVGAYFGNLDAYQLYYNQRAQIEERLGRRMEWTKHLTKASAYLYDSVDFDENHGWEKAFEVIKSEMLAFRKNFKIEE